MVTIQNHLGKINITKHFLVTLIGGTVTNCFGVVEMNAGTAKQSFLDSVPFFPGKNYIDKGVALRYKGNSLIIGLHISVMYGVNVKSVVKSIQNKVRYAVEDETGLTVEAVDVFIDGIKEL